MRATNSHTAKSLADVLERDYKLSEGAQLFLSGHEWGLVIAALRADAPTPKTANEMPDEVEQLVRALTDYEQADPDGVFVKVSRQACDEAAELICARYERELQRKSE